MPGDFVFAHLESRVEIRTAAASNPTSRCHALTSALQPNKGGDGTVPLFSGCASQGTRWRRNRAETGGIAIDLVAELSVFSAGVEGARESLQPIGLLGGRSKNHLGH
jgi:hypothetical protein